MHPSIELYLKRIKNNDPGLKTVILTDPSNEASSMQEISAVLGALAANHQVASQINELDLSECNLQVVDLSIMTGLTKVNLFDNPLTAITKIILHKSMLENPKLRILGCQLEDFTEHQINQITLREYVVAMLNNISFTENATSYKRKSETHAHLYFAWEYISCPLRKDRAQNTIIESFKNAFGEHSRAVRVLNKFLKSDEMRKILHGHKYVITEGMIGRYERSIKYFQLYIMRGEYDEMLNILKILLDHDPEFALIFSQHLLHSVLLTNFDEMKEHYNLKRLYSPLKWSIDRAVAMNSLVGWILSIKEANPHLELTTTISNLMYKGHNETTEDTELMKIVKSIEEKQPIENNLIYLTPMAEQVISNMLYQHSNYRSHNIRPLNTLVEDSDEGRPTRQHRVVCALVD